MAGQGTAASGTVRMLWVRSYPIVQAEAVVAQMPGTKNRGLSQGLFLVWRWEFGQQAARLMTLGHGAPNRVEPRQAVRSPAPLSGSNFGVSSLHQNLEFHHRSALLPASRINHSKSHFCQSPAASSETRRCARPAAMPPFLDHTHLFAAIQEHASPMIAALAANDRLRDHSLRRFERDDPPPYTSSTESEGFDHDDFFAQQQQQHQPRGVAGVQGNLQDEPRELPEELQAIMECPITDQEAETLARSLARLLRPRNVYWAQSMHEERRLFDTGPVHLLPARGEPTMRRRHSSQYQAPVGEARRMESPMGVSRTQVAAQR